MPNEPEPEIPTFPATIEAGVVKLKFGDVAKLMFPMAAAMSAIELGYVAVAMGSLIRDAQQTGRGGLMEFWARVTAAILGELEIRKVSFEDVLRLATHDLAQRALIAAEPATGGGVN